MKSPQEVLLKQLSLTSIGFDYVFEPDEYRKGASVREPADLVWACNNCLILMYMYQRKHKKRTPEQHAQFRRGMIGHKLDQAKGWLREWRVRGRPITGNNEMRSFSIEPADFQYIVVLSVLDCGDHDGEYHEDFVREHNVTHCATVPQSALLHIAHMGAGIMTVIELVGILAVHSKTRAGVLCSTNQVLALLHKSALDNADPQRKWLTENPDEMTGFLHDFLTRLRASSQDVRLELPSGEIEWSPASILLDLSLSAWYSILYELRKGIAFAGPTNERASIIGLESDGYNVCIAVVAFLSGNTNENLIPITNQIIDTYSHESTKGILLLTWDTTLKMCFVTSAKKQGRRNTDDSMEKIAKKLQAT